MKIEKRGEDSYRVRKMYKGQMYTVSFDHKPTQKEAMQAMAKELDKLQEKHKAMTFQVAAEKYIDSKRNVLSPTTIRGYTSAMQTISKKFHGQNPRHNCYGHPNGNSGLTLPCHRSSKMSHISRQTRT